MERVIGVLVVILGFIVLFRVRELWTMWKYTRMVVLTALTAAVYAAILIPFKGLVIVPGFTEVRPANVVPVVFGILFGPAGAWGAAIGNLIGDFFGTLGLGSLFGFLGNFFFGFIPYKVWSRHGLVKRNAEPYLNSVNQLIEFWLTTIIASIICAVIIAWGLEILAVLPFAVLGSIITVNNSIAAGILGPIVMFLIYPRVKQLGLIWTDIMESADISGPLNVPLGVLLTWIGGLGGLIVGLYASTSLYGAGIGAAFGRGSIGPVVIFGLVPFVALIYVGVYLLSLGKYEPQEAA
jgi:energy-coupling factor transport system substrate-specific component